MHPSANVDEPTELNEPTRTAPPVRLLVVIDQLEELFGWEPDARQRSLIPAPSLVGKRSGVESLATLRSDFYAQVIEEPILKALSEGTHQYNLAPLNDAQLQAVIEEPARAAGLTFGRDAQGVGLHERILEEAQGQADVLPLLEFSLSQLYHERDLSQRQLTYVAYQRMGGLKEALGQQAEATVQALGADGEAAFAGAMRPLVRIDPNNKAQSQPAPRSAFTTPGRQRLADAPIEARLLVAEGAYTTPAATPTDPTQDAQASQPTSGPELPHDTNITQEARIKLAHEALLTHWGRLKAWLDDNRDFLRWRGRVEEEARRWEEEGQHPGPLATGR